MEQDGCIQRLEEELRLRKCSDKTAKLQTTQIYTHVANKDIKKLANLL